MTHHWWRDLKPDELKAIHNREDYPIIAVVDGLSEDERKEIYSSIKVKPDYCNDFAQQQTTWINDLCYYLGQKLGKDAKDCQELSQEINGPFHERFRVYYAAKYPNRIEVFKVNRLTLDFLTEIDDINRLEKLVINQK